MSVPTTGLSKLKKKHIRVKHQKVKLFRANEPLLSVFMWGVNHTVNFIFFVYRANKIASVVNPRARQANRICVDYYRVSCNSIMSFPFRLDCCGFAVFTFALDAYQKFANSNCRANSWHNVNFYCYYRIDIEYINSKHVFINKSPFYWQLVDILFLKAVIYALFYVIKF